MRDINTQIIKIKERVNNLNTFRDKTQQIKQQNTVNQSIRKINGILDKNHKYLLL